jgi:hypothetical protein
MSEILVNKLTGTSTAGDITVTSEGGAVTMQLQQGLAKAWQSITASGGTPSFNDSFNTSSILDSNVGRYTLNFSNSFSSVNYAVTGSCQTSSTSQLSNSGEFRVGDLTTGTEAFSTANEGQTVFVDCPRTHIHQLGDLA